MEGYSGMFSQKQTCYENLQFFMQIVFTSDLELYCIIQKTVYVSALSSTRSNPSATDPVGESNAERASSFSVASANTILGPALSSLGSSKTECSRSSSSSSSLSISPWIALSPSATVSGLAHNACSVGDCSLQTRRQPSGVGEVK
jgi:hypothetical protein